MAEQTLRKLSEFLMGDVGSVLRAEREQRGVSLRSVAKRVGISASALSQIETGRSRPSVATLYAVVSELGITMDELFGSRDEEADGELAATADAPARLAGTVQPNAAAPHAGPVQRGASRKALELDSGVRWERLTPTSDPAIDFLFVRYAVGSASSPDSLAIRHSGHEYGLVLRGRLRVSIGFDSYELASGDSISFDSSIPHLLENMGDEEVEAVWCVVGRGGDRRLNELASALVRDGVPGSRG